MALAPRGWRRSSFAAGATIADIGAGADVIGTAVVPKTAALPAGGAEIGHARQSVVADRVPAAKLAKAPARRSAAAERGANQIAVAGEIAAAELVEIAAFLTGGVNDGMADEGSFAHAGRIAEVPATRFGHAAARLADGAVAARQAIGADAAGAADEPG